MGHHALPLKNLRVHLLEQLTTLAKTKLSSEGADVCNAYMAHLPESVPFFIRNGQVLADALEKAPPIADPRLPFPNVFVELTDFLDIEKWGILIYEDMQRDQPCFTAMSFFRKNGEWLLPLFCVSIPIATFAQDNFSENSSERIMFVGDIAQKMSETEIQAVLRSNPDDVVQFRNIARITCGFITLLNCANVQPEVIKASHNLNKKRKKRGKHPLDDYHVVRVNTNPRRYRGYTQEHVVDDEEARKSPETHLRRGHYRFYKSCQKRIWFPPVIVNAEKDNTVYMV